MLVVGLGTETPFGPPGSTSGANGTIDGSHVYADNGIYTVTVTVTDDDGQATSDTMTVTVDNVAPIVETVFVDVEVSMLIAGEEGSSVELVIEQEGYEPVSLELVRTTGSPNKGSVFVSIDLSKAYTATLNFASQNQKGGTPVWLSVGDNVVKVAMFNAQKKKAHTWNQTQQVDLAPVVFASGVDLSFRASATDVGSDDLTYIWDFGDGSGAIESTYFNDGSGPDPYPSPHGVSPFSAVDVQGHTYDNGEEEFVTYTLRLTVLDDDGGSVVLPYDLTIHLND